MATGTVTEIVHRGDGTVVPPGTQVTIYTSLYNGAAISTPAYAGDTGDSLVGKVTATTDNAGTWSKALEETDIMTPSGTLWVRVYTVDGITYQNYFAVPGTGSYNFETVVQPTPTSGVSAIYYSSPLTGRYLFLPTGWDDTWRTAKTASATTPAWIAFLGDSVAQGAATTTYLTQGFPAVITAGLKTRYPTEYAEYHPVSDSVYVNAGFGGTPPWVINDTAHATWNGGYAVNGALYWSGAVTNPMATFTTPVACTAVDIVFINPFAANGTTLSYTIDGGATQTWTNVVQNGNGTQHIRITGLSNATHIIRITGQSNDFAIVLMGAACYPNGVTGTGVGYVRAATTGMSVTNFMISGQQPSLGQNFRLWNGTNGNGTARALGFPMQPHAAIVELGINDCTSYTLTQFRYGMNRLIESLRYGQENCSIIIVGAANPIPTPWTDMTSTPTGNTSTYDQYLGVMRNIADAHRCAYFDVASLVGSTGVTDGYFAATAGPHGTVAYHALIANSLLAVL